MRAPNANVHWRSLASLGVHVGLIFLSKNTRKAFIIAASMDPGGTNSVPGRIQEEPFLASNGRSGKNRDGSKSGPSLTYQGSLKIRARTEGVPRWAQVPI